MEFAGTFIINDASLDGHSERVLPEGLSVDRFKGNPVMFWGHHRSRAWDGELAKLLPIGKWENLRLKDSQWLADAYVDTGDQFGRDVVRKVKAGIINATSIGFKTIEYSDDPETKVIGQKGWTITKSELMEISLVDIPSNPNTLAVKSLAAEIKTKSEANQVYAVKYYSNNNKKTDMFDKIKSWFKENPEGKEEDFKAKFDNVFDTKNFKDAEGHFATKSEMDAVMVLLKKAQEPETVNALIDAKLKSDAADATERAKQIEESKSLLADVTKAIADLKAAKSGKEPEGNGGGNITPEVKPEGTTLSNFNKAVTMSTEDAEKALAKYL